MRERKPAKGSQNDTRTRIINAAIELFNDYGFDETTIPMICEKAKVSKTTLHYYFPRKQDIFLDMQNNFEELYADNFTASSSRRLSASRSGRSSTSCARVIFSTVRVFPSSTSSADSKSILSVILLRIFITRKC